MNILTAEKCRDRLRELQLAKTFGGISLKEQSYFEALEIALPVLEQQEKGTDLISTPQHVLDEKFNEHFGAPPQPTADTTPHVDNDGWIEWHGGDCPVDGRNKVETKIRTGKVVPAGIASAWFWRHLQTEDDIIAYRVVEQERERGEEE